MIPKRAVQGMTLKMLPFADAASDGLPLSQLLRLSLFQISVGMAAVMLLGTLNRVMIVELSVPAFIVATMIAIPVLIAPFRALLGFKSDNYRSAIGWKRVPYLWFGTLWQFGGLAIMPMALLVLAGDSAIDAGFFGQVAAALAFLLTGLGMHMTQTAGLALAADRASEETRAKVVSLLYVMYLLGMGVSAVIIGSLLKDYSSLLLVQVVQGAAVVTMVLNIVALWKQEKMSPMTKDERSAPQPAFRTAWADLTRETDMLRLVVTIFLGTIAFNMQDVLLEPYGGEILGLSVSATTLLTAMWACGALLGFGLAARWLSNGIDTYRMGGRGVIVGILAFSAVLLSAPLASPILFYTGAALIGLGGGLFAVATLTAAMTINVAGSAGRGLALGVWGAAQATGAGLSIFIGGATRDLVNSAASNGILGDVLQAPSIGYSVVYQIEIGLLFITLVALGPLVRAKGLDTSNPRKLELTDFPI
ncbi:PucC family protein [Thalassobium sp. R2A62]|jgi:BCD family chlorophyll transporter-like MFS transporter|uniref:PucC family protein n=1 Tax=Thalassobium sp. R2A62 TaxID=633131 RepID=UPI0001B1D52B|nr:PucC family protein [Thalassobium sp. R2A62]EET49153.1 protein PucC [Thalassobium sp. R2A62]